MLEKIKEALKVLKEFSSFLLNKITSFFSSWFTNNNSRSTPTEPPVDTDQSDPLTSSDPAVDPAVSKKPTPLTFPNATELDIDLTIAADAPSSPNPVSEQNKSSSRPVSPK
jgi:hypothetical protein